MWPVVFLATLSALIFALAGRAGDDRVAAARRLERLVAAGGPGLRHEGWFARADRWLLRLPHAAAVGRRAREAGISVPVSALLLAAAALTVAAGAVAAAWRGPEAGAAIALAVAGLTWAALGAARGRRIKAIEAQLPAALDLLIGQLRAHRSIGEAVTDIAQWVSEPLRGECARAAEELRFGTPLRAVLERFRERVSARAVPAIVTAIVVAERSGANLAEFLARQSATIRAQLAFHQEVRAMTVHARATGTVLTLLPVVVAAAMVIFDRDAFDPMTRSPAGRALLGCAVLMECCGWQAIRMMIRRVGP